MSRSRAALTLAAGLVCLALAGCSSDTTTITLDGPGDIPQGRATLDALTSPEKVPVMLREEVGEAVTVRRVSLTSNGFSAEVRDSAKPQNLDRYSYYSGRWDTEPISVSMSDIEQLDTTTFSLGAVDWKIIPELQRKALAGLDLEDEEIGAVSIDRISGDPVRIYVGVQGSRGNGALISNGRGGDVVVRRF